tara:strand:+ start:186 stop:422 length:237 start_codon:yes stop_codon:yes gene_type:complete
LTESRDMGEQPVAAILAEHGLKANDLVKASATPMTHKMVKRACKGRKLTGNTMRIVRDALNLCLSAKYGLPDLFNYKP